MAGDIATLAKARRELEELYSGIPDESVNLTFQDFAQVKQLPTTAPVAADHSNKSSMERKASGLVITSHNNIVKSSSSSSSALTKLPSLDFNKAFEEASIIHHNSNNNNLQHNHETTRSNSYYVGSTTDHQGSTMHGRQFYSSFMDHYGEEAALHTSQLATSTNRPPRAAGLDSDYNVNYGHDNNLLHHHLPDHHNGHHHHQAIGNSAPGYHNHHHHQQAAGRMGLNSDHHHDMISSSGTSSMMMSNNFTDSFQGSSIGGTRRRRPGIPHSNICSICSVYMYMFRNNRCLVCGRVYCRQCVSIGMGEMTEGRKCIQCLGKRFSQRYIDRAGKTGGCCMGFLDSSSTNRARQREIEWAEKGPRKSSGSNTNTTSATPSRNYNNYSRSEVSPRTPTSSAHGGGAHRAALPPDFSRSSSPSPYSPYSTTHSPASNYHFPL